LLIEAMADGSPAVVGRVLLILKVHSEPVHSFLKLPEGEHDVIV